MAMGGKGGQTSILRNYVRIVILSGKVKQLERQLVLLLSFYVSWIVIYFHLVAPLQLWILRSRCCSSYEIKDSARYLSQSSWRQKRERKYTRARFLRFTFRIVPTRENRYIVLLPMDVDLRNCMENERKTSRRYHHVPDRSRNIRRRDYYIIS